MSTKGTTRGTGVTVLGWILAALILTLLVPTMLVNRDVFWQAILVLGSAAATSGLLVGGYWLIRRGWKGQVTFVAALVVLAGISLAVLNHHEGDNYGPSHSGSGGGVQTALVASTAKLVGDDHWEVTHTMILPQGSREGDELGDEDGRHWDLVDVVDGRPIYEQTQQVQVHLSRFDTSQSTIDVPWAAGHDVGYRVGEGSTLTLLTPRDAVYGTTPTSGDPVNTSDLEVSATEVEYAWFDDEVEVGLAGTWARGPLWGKVYTVASYGWWTIAATALLAFLLFLGRRTLAAAGNWVWGGLRTVRELASDEPGDTGGGHVAAASSRASHSRSGLSSSRAKTHHGGHRPESRSRAPH